MFWDFDLNYLRRDKCLSSFFQLKAKVLEHNLGWQEVQGQMTFMSPRRRGTHSALHTSSSAPGHSRDCMCKAEKETEEDHGTSEQPVAAHTSSSQSQWTDADEHWGWASLNQRRSSTLANIYVCIHIRMCYLCLCALI